jgi:hypothetical protein
MRSTTRAFAMTRACPVETEELLEFEVHDRIGSVRAATWDPLVGQGSAFLRHGYLQALEQAMGDTMGFRYVLFRDAAAVPVGVAGFQLAEFEDQGGIHGGTACTLGMFKERVRRERKLQALVCGNVFHCGDHGAHFMAEVPRALQLESLDRVMARVMAEAHVRSSVAVRVFKEHWPADAGCAWALEQRGYHALATDVNMVLGIDPCWSDLAGYLHALTAKARTRLRAILERSSALEVMELDANAMVVHAGRMQQLLDAVVERSPYIFGRLKVEAYAGWKRHFGEDMVVRGYMLHGELVGFSAAFVNGDCLDAQFVGIDYVHNRQHAIYLRMLVDLLELGISRGVRSVNYGRTSEQAKSGLGALPVSMGVHVKLCGPVANMVAGAFIRKVKPGTFELRSPFKG